MSEEARGIIQNGSFRLVEFQVRDPEDGSLKDRVRLKRPEGVTSGRAPDLEKHLMPTTNLPHGLIPGQEVRGTLLFLIEKDDGSYQVGDDTYFIFL
jgi:hypothetical protein